MVKTLPYNAGGAGLIPGQQAKIPHVSWTKRKKYRNNIVINSIKTSKKLQKIERLISPATHTHTHTPATLKPSSLPDLPCSFHVTDWVCFFLLNSYPILPVQVFQQECIFPSFQEKNKHCMIHSFNNMDISILAF